MEFVAQQVTSREHHTLI